MNMIKDLIKSLFGYAAFVVMVGMVLALLRFAGPDVGFCRVLGKGSAQEVICFRVMKFQGNDFWSFLRVSVYTGRALQSYK